MNTGIDTSRAYSLKEAFEACAEYLRSAAGSECLHPSGPAIRWELKIEPLDILSWLNQQDHDVKIYWSSRDREWTLGALGAAYSLEWKTSVNYETILSRMKGFISDQNPRQCFYGGFCFDANNSDSDWAGFGTCRFVMPRFEILTIEEGTYFAFSMMPEEQKKETINKFLNELKNIETSNPSFKKRIQTPFERSDQPSREQWNFNVQGILNSINNKSYQKIVLARKSTFHFDETLNPLTILDQLSEHTSNCFLFSYQFKEGEAFLGASPERLYLRQGKKISTEALAGTRPRGHTAAEDEQFMMDLRQSKKDAVEHAIVRQMLKKQLERLCDQVAGDRRPSFLTLKGGHHLISRFHGHLKNKVNDAQILDALHPTPAIAGTPTTQALIEIKNKEPFGRGWYAGPLGVFGYNHAEFCVAIRSGLILTNALYLYAGAGIVQGSTASDEWNEIEHKLTSFLKIFSS